MNENGKTTTPLMVRRVLSQRCIGYNAGPLDDAPAAAIQDGQPVALRWEERAADTINEDENADENAYRCVWPVKREGEA